MLNSLASGDAATDVQHCSLQLFWEKGSCACMWWLWAQAAAAAAALYAAALSLHAFWKSFVDASWDYSPVVLKLWQAATLLLE
jgi:hypothetical protein